MANLSRRSFVGLGGAALIFPVAAQARLFGKDGPVFVYRGRAIRGIDPVAYFTDGKPVQGMDHYTTEWKGAVWQFASADNRSAFESNPRKFAPRYGGYCAWGVSQNYTATTEPEAWTIHEDRLYLNYSLGIREHWALDIPGNIEKGDANWPGLVKAMRS